MSVSNNSCLPTQFSYKAVEKLTTFLAHNQTAPLIFTCPARMWRILQLVCITANLITSYQNHYTTTLQFLKELFSDPLSTMALGSLSIRLKFTVTSTDSATVQH